MYKLSRILTAATRFAKCGERLGWRAALQAYLVARVLRRPVAIRLPATKTLFHLRPGASDLGSFATFYLGYPYVSTDRVRTILDGGANIGDSAVFFASHYRPEFLLAVEPDGENFKLLKKNTVGFPCVAACQCALWSHDTMVSLETSAGSTVSSRVAEKREGGDQVPARSIMSLAEEHRLTGFDLVKLDIEGAEREVLAGTAAAWLGACWIFIVELHDHLAPGAGMALVRAVEQYGPFSIRQAGEYLIFFRGERDPAADVRYEK